MVMTYCCEDIVVLYVHFNVYVDVHVLYQSQVGGFTNTPETTARFIIPYNN